MLDITNKMLSEVLIMKKRLLGLILIMAMVVGFSVSAYADIESKPWPGPHIPLSIELNDFK